MSISYKSIKCNSCGSTKFDYIESVNMWECAYCGNMVERHEESDSVYSVKDAVRQALVHISYKRFQEASDSINECAKFDSKYVGTIIARLCYSLNAAFYSNVTDQERKNLIAQAKKYYSMLMEKGDTPKDEEVVLYEFLESAEACGVLILAFDAFNLQNRIDVIYEFFKPEEVYSMFLNANLLSFMLKRERFDLVDGIVKNHDNLEKKQALALILDKYPDNEQKAENINLLISNMTLASDDIAVIEGYFQGSDNVSTKLEIACTALKNEAKPSVRCVMDSIVPNVTDLESLKKLLEIMLSNKLVDEEIYTIVEYALQKCSQETILFIFELFKQTNQFVVLNYQHFAQIFDNKGIDLEHQFKITELALEFNVNDKKKEQIISYYLNNCADSPKDRQKFLEYLFKLLPSISTASAESYIVNCTLDGDNKPEIVKMIFALNINKAFFRETFDKYAAYSKDAAAVSSEVIDVLTANGLVMSEATLVNLLLKPDTPLENKLAILRRAKNSQVRYLSALDKYLTGVNPQAYSGWILQELIGYTDTVSAASCVKYLINIKDTETIKSDTAAHLVNRCRAGVFDALYKVSYQGMTIECNALQAYILLTPDSPEVSAGVVSTLAPQARLNSDVLVNGSKKKFKKLISSVGGSMNASSQAAANASGL